MSKPLVILTGPTAAGKTNLSIQLAKRINGEIISADSMQVYRKMDIGTAKIRTEEMEGVPHHLIDIMDPGEDFNVVLFKENAVRCMNEIYGRGRIPIIVGGTGFYIQAVLNDIDFSESEEDSKLRQELESIANEKSPEYLHQMLREVDALSAETIHPNNVKRVIRAIEYYHQTGERISDHNKAQREKVSPYNFAYFVLTLDRELLYERINQRVDVMMERGLLDEVKELRDQGYGRNLVSMQGLGYKEIYSYLEGECDLQEAVYLLKRETRHFAKRQLTWFRRENDVIMLNKSEYDNQDELVLAELLNKLGEKGII